jgi:hypothetical protein
MLVELQTAICKNESCWAAILEENARHPVVDIAQHVLAVAERRRNNAPVLVLLGSDTEAHALDLAYRQVNATDQRALRQLAEQGDLPQEKQVAFMSYGGLLAHITAVGVAEIIGDLAKLRTVVIADQVLDLSVDFDLVLASLALYMKELHAGLLLLVLNRTEEDVEWLRRQMGEPDFAVDIFAGTPDVRKQVVYNADAATVSELVKKSLRDNQNVLYFGDKPPTDIHPDDMINISSWSDQLTGLNACGYVITVAPSVCSRAITVPNLALVVSASPEYRIASNHGANLLQMDRMEKLTQAHHQLQLQFAEQAGSFVACYPRDATDEFPVSPHAVQEARTHHSGDILRLAMGSSWLFHGRKLDTLPVYGRVATTMHVLLGLSWSRLDALELVEFPPGTMPQSIPKPTKLGKLVFKQWTKIGPDGLCASLAAVCWLRYREYKNNPAAQMWFAKLASVVPRLHELLPLPLSPDLTEDVSRSEGTFNGLARQGSLFVAACVWEAARAKLLKGPLKARENCVEVFGLWVPIKGVRSITKQIESALPDGNLDVVEALDQDDQKLRQNIVTRAFTNMAILIRKDAPIPDQAPRARMLQACIEVDLRPFASIPMTSDTTLAYMSNGVAIEVKSGDQVRLVVIPDDLTIMDSAHLFLYRLMPSIRQPHQAEAWL